MATEETIQKNYNDLINRMYAGELYEIRTAKHTKSPGKIMFSNGSYLELYGLHTKCYTAIMGNVIIVDCATVDEDYHIYLYYAIVDPDLLRVPVKDF